MNLVIQGLDIETRCLKELAKLTAASGIEQITPQAFRLRDAREHDGVAAYCCTHRLDYGYVPVSYTHLAQVQLPGAASVSEAKFQYKVR